MTRQHACSVGLLLISLCPIIDHVSSSAAYMLYIQMYSTCTYSLIATSIVHVLYMYCTCTCTCIQVHIHVHVHVYMYIQYALGIVITPSYSVIAYFNHTIDIT